jgi:predicted helicase
MTQFNPIAGSILQSTPLQRQQASEKARQLRHVQQLEKNIAAEDDRLEHQVESSEELKNIHEDQSQGQSQQRKPKQEPPKPTLDVKA